MVNPKPRIIIGDDKDSLFPVQAFFNAINDNNFIGVISNLTKEIGHGINDACCSFPSDLDPNEKVFEGVRFSLFEDEIIIDRNSFSHYLTIACHSYVETHPTDKDKITDILKSFGNDTSL